MRLKPWSVQYRFPGGRKGKKKAITGWANTSFIDPHEHRTCEGDARAHIVKLIRRFSQTNPPKNDPVGDAQLFLSGFNWLKTTGMKEKSKQTCTLLHKIKQFTRQRIITACLLTARY